MGCCYDMGIVQCSKVKAWNAQIIQFAGYPSVDIELFVHQRFHHFFFFQIWCQETDIAHIDMAFPDIGIDGHAGWIFRNCIQRRVGDHDLITDQCVRCLEQEVLNGCSRVGIDKITLQFVQLEAGMVFDHQRFQIPGDGIRRIINIIHGPCKIGQFQVEIVDSFGARLIIILEPEIRFINDELIH